LRPQVFALLAAMAWGVGGYFEKKGLHHGNLSPQVGTLLRTAAALVVLSIASFAQWKTIPQAGPRSLLYLTIGGGVLGGAVGLMCFYAALKGAPLGKVMPIAFTSPLFGALMGVMFRDETLTARMVIGMLLTMGGIVVLTIG
jgi:transporter family protein